MGVQQDELIGGSRFLRGAEMTRTATAVAAREATARALTRSARASDARRAAASRQQLKAARSLVALLAGMRGAAMKVGQTLSAVDLGVVPEDVRPEFQQILATLQQDAEPVAFSAITRVVEEDLGTQLRTVFAELDPEPLAAASIGQVHRGTLHDGRDVAVKVQYPGIAEAIHADLRNLRLGLKLLSTIAPGIDTATIAAEIRERITEELDYELEAESQRTMARVYRGHPFALVPDVVLEHSGERVLVSEYVEGKRLSEVAATASQLERDRLGEILVRFHLNGPMRHRLLNGDPHPGNVLFPADGRVAFLDFGFCKRLSSREAGDLVRTTRATCEGDAAALLEIVAALGALPPDPRLAAPFLEHYAAIFGWLLDAEPRRIEPGQTAEMMRRYTAMRGQDGFDGLTLPAEHFVLMRGVMLVLGLLGTLRSTNPWFDTTREWLEDAPAVTALGRAEEQFFGSRHPSRQEHRYEHHHR